MKSAGNPGEGICLDSKALQNGGKQPSKRFLLDLNLTLPSGIRVNARPGLVVFIAFTKLEISPISETHVFSTGRDNRVISGKVKAA